MPGDVDHVIDPTHDPEVAILISPCAVTGKVNSFNLRPILLTIPLVIAINRTQHAGPWPRNHEVAAFIRSHPLAVARHHVSFNPGKWLRGGAGLCGRGSGQRRNHDAAGLSLPPRVDDWATLFPDDSVIPHPRFRVYWLAYRAQQTQACQVVFERPLLAPFDEGANRGRRRVENVDAVTFDDVPESIRLRPIRRAFVHESRRAV